MNDEKNSLRKIEVDIGFEVAPDDGQTTTACDGLFPSTSTPRKNHSMSYIDVACVGEKESFLFWTDLQKTKGLSRSVCDLKILGNKDMERRQARLRFQDNFLREHANKLEEARLKIRALEAKYSKQQLRSNTTSPQRDKRSGEERSINCETISVTENLEKALRNLSVRVENRKTSRVRHETSTTEDIDVSKVTQTSVAREPGDDRSGIDCGLTTEATGAGNATRARKKTRPVTWADDEDLCSSDSNSISSHGSSLRKLVKIMSEKGDKHTGTTCCRGYKDSRDRLNLNDSGRHLDHADTQRVTNHNTLGHGSSYFLHCGQNPKWNSMPNLPTNEDSFNETRELMYGEAIPLDPDDRNKKHGTKLGKRSGLYIINESPETTDGLPSKNIKQKFRKKLLIKNGSAKKSSTKHMKVGAPRDGQSIGKVVGLHPTVASAYKIELKREMGGSFGVLIQKGYRQKRRGIFIYRIADRRIEKFFGGLVRAGQEVLEVNNTSVEGQSLAFVNKLISDSDTLLLTVMPGLSRKD